MKPSHFILSVLLGAIVTAFFLGATDLAAVLGLLLIFLAAVSALGYAFRSHRAGRVQHGLCPECGYDLRASSDRCPECGVAIGAGTPKDPNPADREEI